MTLTKQRLIALGWIEQTFDGASYMVKQKLVIRNIAGVWEGGHLILGVPHFIRDKRPLYINSEEDLNHFSQQ